VEVNGDGKSEIFFIGKVYDLYLCVAILGREGAA